MSAASRSGAVQNAVQTGSGAARRLALPLLSSIPGLAHAFTVRGSSLEAALRETAGRDIPILTVKQVHGADVQRIEVETDPSRSPVAQADALVTALPGRALAVYVADCVPVLICDPRRRALAAVHAGWRGTVAGVLTEAIGTLIRAYGSRPEDLRLGLGPAIGPCCFEVGDEVIDRFLAADLSACVLTVPGRRSRVDLIEANRGQALARGVAADAIQSSGLCTRCEPELLESFRRDGPGAGRMAGVIAWID